MDIFWKYTFLVFWFFQAALGFVTKHCFTSGLSITGLMSQTEKQDTASLLMILICCAYMTFKQEAKKVWWENYFSVNQKSVLATRATSIMQTRYTHDKKLIKS